MTSYAHTVNDPTSTVSSLNEQVLALKSAVEATFNKPMAEILANLEATDADARAQDANAALQGRLTGAKLLVSAAYVFLDVIWMYLKSKGVDPKTHPVHMELERVHTYFAKLKKAEHSDGDTASAGPSQRIDAAAASRMVAAAAGEKRKHTRFDEDEEKPRPVNEKKTKDISATPELSSKSKPKKTKKKEALSNLETFAQDKLREADVKASKNGEKSSKPKHKTDAESKKKKKKKQV
ncbi:hypothetical protein CBS9595_001305 [Malassezia furfur]|nr:hypothetical protein CBS9595_001305 [Malassezia furfur]